MKTVPSLIAVALPLLGAAVVTPLALTAVAQAAPPEGVTYPAGGQRLPASDASVAGFGRLLGVVAGEFDLPAGSGNGTEVLAWTGSDYKPGRAGFRRSALRSALTAAGYKVEEKERSDVNLNPFEEQYGLSATPDGPSPGSVNFRVTGTFYYFKAVNAKTKSALVGMWVDDDSEGKLLLAIAPAGFKADPSDAPLPGLPAGAVLVSDSNDSMKGVPAPAPPTFPKLTRKPRTLRGMVKDAAGRPIAGAQFVVWASAAGGFRTDVSGVSNAQGIYEIPLPVGICQVVNADCMVKYGGRSYRLPLQPADGERENFNSTAGAIENFYLRTWGQASANGHFGATIRVLEWVPETGKAGQDGTIEVTLTPQGPLLDGSAGKTLVYRYANGVVGEKYLKDVPIGRYRITAALLDSGERLPLRVKPTFGDADFTDALPVEFEGENGELASLGHTGIKQFEVTLKP